MDKTDSLELPGGRFGLPLSLYSTLLQLVIDGGSSNSYIVLSMGNLYNPEPYEIICWDYFQPLDESPQGTSTRDHATKQRTQQAKEINSCMLLLHEHAKTSFIRFKITGVLYNETTAASLKNPDAPRPDQRQVVQPRTSVRQTICTPSMSNVIESSRNTQWAWHGCKALAGCVIRRT